MIFGIGTDIIEISRLAAAAENPRFLQRVFAGEEAAAAKRPESLAAGFAAKEAVAKAMGVGLDRVSLPEILILHEESGRPVIRLSGKTLALAEKLGIGGWMVSLSHNQSVAVAFVIALRRENNAFN